MVMTGLCVQVQLSAGLPGLAAPDLGNDGSVGDWVVALQIGTTRTGQSTAQNEQDLSLHGPSRIRNCPS